MMPLGVGRVPTGRRSRAAGGRARCRLPDRPRSPVRPAAMREACRHAARGSHRRRRLFESRRFRTLICPPLLTSSVTHGATSRPAVRRDGRAILRRNNSAIIQVNVSITRKALSSVACASRRRRGRKRPVGPATAAGDGQRGENGELTASGRHPARRQIRELRAVLHVEEFFERADVVADLCSDVRSALAISSDRVASRSSTAAARRRARSRASVRCVPRGTATRHDAPRGSPTAHRRSRDRRSTVPCVSDVTFTATRKSRRAGRTARRCSHARADGRQAPASCGRRCLRGRLDLVEPPRDRKAALPHQANRGSLS